MKIITTIGTSLIDNYNKAKKFTELPALPTECEIYLNNELALPQQKRFLNRINVFFKGYKRYKDENGFPKWEQCDENELNIDASAEIKSIIKIANGTKTEVYLLHTDTEASRLSALGIKQFFENFKDKYNYLNIKDPKKIEGLKVDDQVQFDEVGSGNLFNELYLLTCKDQEGDKNGTILNISGGYKSLVPYLTIFGQIKDLDIMYLYEDSEELIKIPPLPIDIDWAVTEAVGAYLSEEYLNKEAQNQDSEILLSLAANKLVHLENGKYVLSALGFLMREALFKSNLKNQVLGSYFELKYYQYYSESGGNSSNAQFKNPRIEDFDYGFKVEGGQIDLKEFRRINGNLIVTDEYGEIEIDLILKDTSGHDYIVEIKSLHQVKNNLHKAIGNIKKDYLYNLKAKILAYEKIYGGKPQGLILLINQVFMLNSYPAIDMAMDLEIQEVLEYFKNKIDIHFMSLGYNHEFVKNDLKINYDFVLRKKIESEKFIRLI